jgi:carbon monoxide dehydrogenase subunit G
MVFGEEMVGGRLRKGGATVALTEKDGGTLLTYNVEANRGVFAQFGQRLVNGAAKRSLTISSGSLQPVLLLHDQVTLEVCSFSLRL